MKRFNFGVLQHNLDKVWDFAKTNKVHFQYVGRLSGEQEILVYHGCMTEETEVVFKLTVPVLTTKIVTQTWSLSRY